MSTTPDTPGSSADGATSRDEELAAGPAIPGSATDAVIRVATAGAVIRVAAALIVDTEGRLLLVRKAGTHVFMQPGGKYEPGETGAQTLSRELHEELGLVVAPDALEPLGTFLAPAANEAGMLVEAEVFRVATLERTTAESISAAAEIAELQWVHPDDVGAVRVAPLVTDHMLPLLANARVTGTAHNDAADPRE